jgi:hypothetical protein
MNNIVTWEYYTSLHNKASQDDFVRLEILAEKYVLSVIGYLKWNLINTSAFYYPQLKDCICKVIDKLIDLDEGSAGSGLASVSNDGYTENYVVKTPTEADDEMRRCITRWLSGTGLVSAFSLGG